MKLLFLCAVLFLNYSFAYGDRKKYTKHGLVAQLKQLCECRQPVPFDPWNGKRETYQAAENRVNEKQVNVDDLKIERASADDNGEKERNVIFGNRRKEDGLSFLWKRINKRRPGLSCNPSGLLIEECVNEGCYDEEILEVC